MAGHGRVLQLGTDGAGCHATGRWDFIPVHASTESGAGGIDSIGNRVSYCSRDPFGEWNRCSRDPIPVDSSALRDHCGTSGCTTTPSLL
jgi:hypothetical protein